MRTLITHLEFSGIILFSLYLFLKQTILFFSLEVMIIILFFCLSIYLAVPGLRFGMQHLQLQHGNS